MNQAMSFERKVKLPLVLAVAAVFAAGCASTRAPEPTAQSNWTGPAGPSGPAGATGPTGPQGAIGSMGAQGPAAATGGTWSSYRDYTFNGNSDDIVSSDGNKAREVASYVNQNPSLRVAIDGFSERRVINVRKALIDAGVPANRIQTGAYGDAQARRDGHVAVLVSN